MVRYANHIFLVHVKGSLELASGRAEAVQDEVLPHAVDPLSPRGQCAAHKVSSFSFTRGEGSDNLSLHVHDHDRVGSVAHDHLVLVLGEDVHAVNVHVTARRTSQGLESILTF